MKNIVLSKHACERGQQRGVPREAIALVALHGKRTRVKEGKFQRMIRKPEALKLITCKTSPASLVERTKGLRIITSEIEDQVMVVSVLPRSN